MLVAVAGLPGAGKSAVAEALGRKSAAPVVSVDPIEAAMRRAGTGPEQPTGLAAYAVAEAVAEAVADGVPAPGQHVIVDAANAVEAARGQWRAPASRHGGSALFPEAACPDPELHRRRLAGRSRGIADFPEPTRAPVQWLRAEFEPRPARTPARANPGPR
ncbi:AAA family ATPase [Kitasatospora sp. NPDC088783]|uniref:AAA family ATPase n=1 Tax=Kitasatospora sp. NPDC088783 TaxID=3364077 RepID=UPI00382E8FCB